MYLDLLCYKYPINFTANINLMYHVDVSFLKSLNPKPVQKLYCTLNFILNHSNQMEQTKALEHLNI